MMDKDGLYRLLSAALAEGELLCDEPMAAHTTFAAGGPADFLARPHNAEEVAAILRITREAEAPLYPIGCGSNVLVADSGLRGIVLDLSRLDAVEVDACLVHAQAGATNERVAQAALEAGLSGYEFASGIPGSIGGAAIMNAGAYEGEFRDVAVSVTCLAPDGKLREVPAAEAGWSYRRSRMMNEGLLVLAATLRLEPGDRTEIRRKMDELAARRAEKQPLEFASAGSTFKRPAGHFAGKLVQEAGMRGHAVGTAMVSEKHCGFVVNTGGASAADILQVIRDVQAGVLAHSGVRLEPEVRLWGFSVC